RDGDVVEGAVGSSSELDSIRAAARARAPEDRASHDHRVDAAANTALQAHRVVTTADRALLDGDVLSIHDVDAIVRDVIALDVQVAEQHVIRFHAHQAPNRSLLQIEILHG